MIDLLMKPPEGHTLPEFRGTYRKAADQPFVRTPGMSRWHIPKAMLDLGAGTSATRTAISLWCGQLVHAGPTKNGMWREQRAATVPQWSDLPADGLPVCATCYGRAVGYGIEGLPAANLIHEPREARS